MDYPLNELVLTLSPEVVDNYGLILYLHLGYSQIMYQGELERSPNWDKYQGVEGFVKDGFPFHEGLPRVFYKDQESLWVDPYLFQIITRDGGRHIAAVDSSTQYRAEGLNWMTLLPKRGIVYPHTVVAWRELDESEYPQGLSR